jgi:short-subunit dehydrogenase involved in D-alanine esterification of teichoic acids
MRVFIVYLLLGLALLTQPLEISTGPTFIPAADSRTYPGTDTSVHSFAQWLKK